MVAEAAVPLRPQQVLLQDVAGTVYAVSNKCSHLGLSLQGKTPLLSAKLDCGDGKSPCIICPAHNTAFSLATGAVQGEWCPGFPDLPFVGKMKPSAPLPTFKVLVDGDDISVAV
jgi:nitrite reductase/ring-hydroxylating ferredoxin subunit